jgi:hypothetical protein
VRAVACGFQAFAEGVVLRDGGWVVVGVGVFSTGAGEVEVVEEEGRRGRA